MYRILYIHKDLGFGGAEVSTITLLEGFIEMGLEVDLLVFDKGENVRNLPNGINLMSLNSRDYKYNPFRNVILSKKIEKIYRSGSYDFVLCDYTSKSAERILKNTSFCNEIVFIIRNSFTKKRIARNKSVIFRIMKKIYLRNYYKRKNIITVSENVKNDIIHKIRIKPNRIKCIYNPFDVKKILDLSNEYNVKFDYPYIISVARFVLRHKRQDVLLKAFKLANLNMKLILLGKGKDKNKIEKLVYELNLQDKVVFHEPVVNPYPLIKNAKLLVLSSDFEGLARVAVESLILGTPVVSTCWDGVEEVLVGSLKNYSVPIGDYKSLARVISKAIHEYPQITMDLTEKFDKNIVCKQYIEYLKKCKTN